MSESSVSLLLQSRVRLTGNIGLEWAKYQGRSVEMGPYILPGGPWRNCVNEKDKYWVIQITRFPISSDQWLVGPLPGLCIWDEVGVRGLLKVFEMKYFLPLDVSLASAYLKATMSFKDPPTLQQLARRSLLKDEALTISALPNLPMQLFPPLFKDAFTSRHPNILRQMVAAWPFPTLPVGSLMKIPHLETLKAVLDGLDLLMSQKDRPRYVSPR